LKAPLRTLDGIPLAGRRVFLRSDLNVPLDGDTVRDASRIDAARQTLDFLRAKGARVVLASHLGRPKGQVRSEFSLRPVATAMGIPLASDCVGPEVERQVGELQDGQVLLLENLRFHKGEEANDPSFAAALARLADVYVNDAFGTAHRAHASTEGIVKHVAESAAGFLLQREIEALTRVLDTPTSPYVCILGGAKVSDKLAVLRALSQRADTVFVGGAMAYTFLLARGQSVGNSLVELERVDDAREMLEGPGEILLPVDHVVADALDRPETARTVTEIPDGAVALDIGPETVAALTPRLAAAKTIFWNGPLGLFERTPFDQGTCAIARAVAESSAYSVVGGGDSLAAVHAAGVAEAIAHLSTGGGASLEFVEGRQLPGIEALRGPR